MDQIVDVLLELADPDLLLVPAAMAEVVADDAVLSVADKLILGLFVKRVENYHSEGRCLVFLSIAHQRGLQINSILDLED